MPPLAFQYFQCLLDRPCRDMIERGTGLNMRGAKGVSQNGNEQKHLRVVRPPENKCEKWDGSAGLYVFYVPLKVVDKHGWVSDIDTVTQLTK